MHCAPLSVANSQSGRTFDVFAKGDRQVAFCRVGADGEAVGCRTALNACILGGETDDVGPVFAWET